MKILKYALCVLPLLGLAEEKVINISQGQDYFDISLPYNAGTGYGWNLKSYNPGQVRLLGEESQVTDTTRLGAGKLSVWHFMINRNYHTKSHSDVSFKITFEKLRPWENQPVETVTYNIVLPETN